MSPRPAQARLALIGFLAVGTGIILNVLFLQDRSVASAVERAKLEKAQQRALSERNRRLALEPKDPKPVASVAVARAVTPPEPATPAAPATNRVGRFAQAPARTTSQPAAPQPVASEPEPERSQDVIRQVQLKLVALGYEPGSSDGVAGLVTRGAIMAFEHDQGLPLSGDPTELLLRQMQLGPTAKDATVRAVRPQRAPHAEQVLRTVQQSLATLGYFAGKVDGRPGDETERAIREYEMDNGLVPTGRVSAPLLNRLARSASGPKAAAR